MLNRLTKRPRLQRRTTGRTVAAGEKGSELVRAKRRQQARSVQTRSAILTAALSEFAEHGFSGASIRRIGARANVEHTLITYHYRSKDKLWRAVAEDAVGRIRKLWDEAAPNNSELTPAERVRIEFRTTLAFLVEHTDFHQFMLRENQIASPRLQWLVTNVLETMMARVVTQIKSAQADGELIAGDPALVYYMLIGMTSVLSSLKGEMRATIGFDISKPTSVETYWRIIENAIFFPNARDRSG